jgi:hypothetical protein
LPFKAGLFFLWLTRLRLRARTAFLTSLSLANYCEFGLIVCSISVAQGLLSKEWLVIMALSVSISFVFSSVINTWGHDLYRRWSKQIKRFETTQRLPEDEIAQLGEATIVVGGMGRVGKGAYDALIEESQQLICGIEMDRDRVTSLCENGRNVVFGDAEDPEFWSSISLDKVQLIMFAMPNYLDILEAQKQLRFSNFTGKTSGVVKYPDEEIALLEGGVDEVFNFYAEVGNGFANESLHLLHNAP